MKGHGGMGGDGRGREEERTDRKDDDERRKGKVGLHCKDTTKVTQDGNGSRGGTEVHHHHNHDALQ